MANELNNLHAEIFKALAHPLRLEVIENLQEGEQCFSDLLGKTGGIKSNLSQHLSIMVNAGILKCRKDSRCNYYKLTSPKITKACTLLGEVMAAHVQSRSKVLSR